MFNYTSRGATAGVSEGNLAPPDPYTQMVQARRREAEAASRRILDDQISAARALQGSNTQSSHTGGISFNNQGGSVADSSGSIASASSRRTPSGGGFGTANPQIDGRYMSLVQFQAPEIKQKTPPREVMPQADFTPADATEFQNAAFGRAKAISGGLGKSAIDSLVSQLAGRGISNSGTTGRGIAGEIVKAVDPLSELNVAHLGQEYSAAQRARELSEQRAAQAYSGAIAQRGQDINSQQALDNLMAQIAQLKYQGEVQQTEGGLNRQLQLQRLYEML